MSKQAEQGELIVTVPAGVAYSICDATGDQLTMQTRSEKFKYPPGLYSVQWRSGGDRSETVVRVAPGKPSRVDFLAAVSPAPPSTQPMILDAARIVRSLRPSERDYGSKIAIVVTAPSAQHASKGLGSVRIHNTADTAMRADEDAAAPLRLSNCEVTRIYNVPPGRYALSFLSHIGETLQQMVPALKGRTTIIFLECVSGKVLVAKGTSFAKISRSGIDPAQTVMISAKGNEPDHRIRERMRLTRLLLSDLGGGSAVLTENFCMILDKRSTDPLLKIAGATAVLSRLETMRPPSVELAIETRSSIDPATAVQWMNKARGWLARSNFSRFPTDLITAWWRIAEMGGGKPVLCPVTLTAPPMFDCGWRWATATSASRPQAIRRSAMTLAASRSNCESGPWLCWRLRAATARPEPVDAADDRNNAELCRTIADLVGLGEGAVYHDVRQRLIDALGPDDVSVITAIERATLMEAPERTAGTVASSLGLPGRALRRQLLRTLKAVENAGRESKPSDGLAAPKPRQPPRNPETARDVLDDMYRADRTASGSSDGSARRRRKQAPALSRAIIVPDDPQFGRFGGQAHRDGFTLSARFENLKSTMWTNIELAVTGAAPDRTPVQFFLHDSFQPSMEEVRFSNGTARLDVTAWGGFTVGVWLPYEGVELELNLAAVAGAPEMIRTR